MYFAAIDKLQAGKAWAEAKAMLDAHPELSERVNIIRFSKEIEVLSGMGAGSVLKAVSADADSKLGMSPSFVLCDEAGYWPNRNLFDAFDSALGARENPLIVVISTQAKDGLNAVGVGAYFNVLNPGQMLLWHVTLLPLAIGVIVALHLVLVRRHGIVPPIDAEAPADDAATATGGAR